MSFKPATRKRVKARLAIVAMSKAGKSMTSLGILRGIVGPEGRIAAIDTENGALSLYSGLFPGANQPSGFDVQDMTNCSPDAYVKGIKEAIAGRYDALLIDSTSQEWASILTMVDGLDDKFFGGWKAATPKHNEFLRTIVTAPLHIICTVRQKDEYVIEQINGKNTPRKVGTEPIQRKQFEYEFNAVMTMDLEHNIRVTHSAIDFLPNGTLIEALPDPEAIVKLGTDIRRWLDDGSEDWTPPQFKKTFYINTAEGQKEIVSEGVEREQYVQIMNMGAAMRKQKKDAKALIKELTGKVSIGELTQEEAKRIIESMQEMLAGGDNV